MEDEIPLATKIKNIKSYNKYSDEKIISFLVRTQGFDADEIAKILSSYDVKKKDSSSDSNSAGDSQESESLGNQTQGSTTSVSGSAGDSDKVSWGATGFSTYGSSSPKSKKGVGSADNDVASRVAENKTIFSATEAVGDLL